MELRQHSNHIKWILLTSCMLTLGILYYNYFCWFGFGFEGNLVSSLQKSFLGGTESSSECVKISKSLQMLSNRIGIPVGHKGSNLTAAETKILHHYLRTHILIPPSTKSVKRLFDAHAAHLNSREVTIKATNQNKTAEHEPIMNSTRPLENKLRQLLAGQRSGFYIEARARDGHNFHSFTAQVLERELGWTGLLIEPVPELVTQLSSQRRRAWIAKACLSLNSTEYMEYFWMNTASAYGNGTAHPPLKLYPPTKLESSRKLEGEPNRIVECFPLQHILAAMNKTTTTSTTPIDLLILNVDGNEYKILNHIPQTIPIKIIVLQHWLVPEGRDAFKGLMYARRYYLTFESDSHYIFIKMKALLGSILNEAQ